MKIHPKLTTVALSTKDTEYGVTLPVDTKAYTIKTRGNTEFKVAYKTGDIAAGTYITVPAGNSKSEDNLNRSAVFTIYVSCEKAAETLEVEYWV